MQKLKRAITLPYLIFYGLGNIIGAGIYVLIGEIAGIAGYYTPLSFLVACFAVLFTALSYAELSSIFPVSAGEAVYVEEGLGAKRVLPTTIGLMLVFSGIVSAATITKGFYGYISEYIPLNETVTIILIITLLTLCAIWGILESVKITAFFTLFGIIGLLVVIVYGLSAIDIDAIDLSKLNPGLTLHNWYLIVLGGFVAFYAFIGFEDMVNVAEEVKDPKTTMPLGILLSLLIATLLYFLVAFVSILVIEPSTLAKSSSPLADVFKKASKSDAAILNIIAIFAIVNGALVQLIMVSRIFYGMAKKRWLPSFLAYVHPKRRTPITATILAALLILFFATFLKVLTLAQITSFLILVVFIFVNLALIGLKMKKKEPKEGFVVPLYVPILAILINLFLLSVQLLDLLELGA